MKLRTGDPVMVTNGKYKGTITKIIKINMKSNKAILDGDVVAVKHRKPVGDSQGEISTVAMPIDISNLSYYDESTKKTSRIAYKYNNDGRKVRYLVQIDKYIE